MQPLPADNTDCKYDCIIIADFQSDLKIDDGFFKIMFA